MFGKRVAVLGALLAALSVATTVATAAFTGGGPSRDPFVVGGGRITPPSTTGFDYGIRDFSIDAHVSQDVGVSGILRYGRNTNAVESSRLGDVRCVRIEGNRAVVGGTTRDTTPTEGWVMFFIDNGTPGGVTDRASYLQVEPLDRGLQSAGFPGWPRGFPYTCPSPSSGPGADAYGSGFLSLDAGDVLVSSGAAPQFRSIIR